MTVMWKLANELLGYRYYVSGIVLHGRQIGRTIGMPTTNLLPPQEKLLPKDGVYLTRTFVKEDEYYGITNVGISLRSAARPAEEWRPISLILMEICMDRISW